MTQKLILVSALLALSTLAPHLQAQTIDPSSKEAIRQLANEGASDFEAQRYEAALDKFKRAYTTAKVPTLGLWVAQTEVKLGHWTMALDSYQLVQNLEPNELWVGTVQQQAQAQAEQEYAALKARVPKLRIKISGAEANKVQIAVDGVVVPSALVEMDRPVDPGTHLVEGKLAGATIRQETKMAEGEQKEIVLAFATTTRPAAATAPTTAERRQEPESAPSTGGMQRTLGWIGLGVGATGLAVGATTGLIVAVKYGKLSDQCPNEKCTPEYWSSADSYATLRTVSTVGFVVGAVGTAAGVTLLLTSPKRERQPSVSVSLLPNAALVAGSF